MSSADAIIAKSSPVNLDPNGSLTRLPLHPERQRSAAFLARFDTQTLYYDCFWSTDKSTIFLIGPAPLNLEADLHAAQFYDQTTGKALNASHHISRSTMMTRLESVPDTCEQIAISIAGQTHVVAVQPNLGTALEGRNILFSMNKNNELGWIRDWAEWHVKLHNVDCVVLFDNGSDAYTLEQLGSALAEVAGLEKVVLFDWPHAFGARDDKVWSYHYWAHFLQISSMNLVLRRCAPLANALINLDVDELLAPLDQGTIVDLIQSRPHRVAALSGKWVSAVTKHATTRVRHADFQHCARGPAPYFCPKKWAIDPRADWVDDLEVFPYWHRIFGAPERKVTEEPVAQFWHFKGISTNWKSHRSTINHPSALLHTLDADLISAQSRVWPTEPDAKGMPYGAEG